MRTDYSTVLTLADAEARIATLEADLALQTRRADALAAAIVDLANVLHVVIVNRGQTAHVERDLRARLGDLVHSLRPPAPATVSEKGSGSVPRGAA